MLELLLDHKPAPHNDLMGVLVRKLSTYRYAILLTKQCRYVYLNNRKQHLAVVIQRLHRAFSC